MACCSPPSAHGARGTGTGYPGPVAIVGLRAVGGGRIAPASDESRGMATAVTAAGAQLVSGLVSPRDPVLPVGAGCTEAGTGHAEYEIQHTPDKHAQTRPREDVEGKVRTEISARQAYRGS